MAKREIVSGIPVPTKRKGGRKGTSDAHSMSINDCVLDFPATLAHSLASQWNIRHNPKQFVARKLPDDVRPDLENRYGVWRVK